jgi:hypothetical protein
MGTINKRRCFAKTANKVQTDSQGQVKHERKVDHFYCYATCTLEKQELATCPLQIELTIHRSIQRVGQVGVGQVGNGSTKTLRVCNKAGECSYQSDPLEIEVSHGDL